jgi:hypothetical protein
MANVIWVMEGTLQSGRSSTSQIVDFINKGNSVMVGDGKTRVNVGVVTPERGNPYIRTYADKKWTDNLLAVVRY